MKPVDVLTRLDQLLEMGKAVHATRAPVPNASWYRVDEGRIKGFRSAVLSFIEMHFGAQHTHYVEFSNAVKGYDENHIKSGLAIVEAIRGEIEGGWLVSIKSLVAAEIFADFIDMAEHLLSAGYKDASAVMLGGVLEEHLRQLCGIHGIDTARDVGGVRVLIKADTLNNDLSKAGVYNKLDQKAVTTWLDLRNKAAHGKYGEYEDVQVGLMHKGLVDFMSRNSR